MELQIPDWLYYVIEKCLEKDPLKRFKDGVGRSLTAVMIEPTRLPLYTEPWPPVLIAPKFSSPSVIVNTFPILFFIHNIIKLNQCGFTKNHLVTIL